jgi:hypothetical protein
MKCIGSMAREAYNRNGTKISWGNFRETNYLKDLSVDKGMILIYILGGRVLD